MDFRHVPIMLNEVIDALNLQQGSVIVDATIGGAGHSSEIIKRILPGGLLIGIDQDEDAIMASQQRLGPYSPNVVIKKANFSDIKKVLSSLGISRVDGILADIGVSSHQLDEAHRGFSYMHDAPLDMRMDRSSKVTAEVLVNTLSKSDLEKIIREYGEERWASRISEFIVRERQQKPIKTTGQLVDIIKAAIPARSRREGPHPAKRTFQALRIAVNDELNNLENAIWDFIDVLRPGGRLAIITFHSLEDRIVKTAFKNAENPCICPKDFPVCICNRKPLIKIITKKPIIPSEEEQQDNPRSRSAKLRVAEKL
ncbi:16S rRNA (cytosine1402-N4)-methyltransferase [Caldanaerobius fijiensis DSM 17918]|uniref:Ribosomal RNA small subunit methyltransferase H n=1 Tax=Caldanaerobius fijiensis DSM 17918 TaxID=1121256 RepID=A0A1M4T373_9THEO|nr:16S rRNA (cytosine(1402)-N(4))-methyltransferase RsmH [Caldanaerobius fijiensis]SHE38916.1 16S rRNA (cytosine1402-N4)-methyltransferase [Caldanaerobius fijiensis DSM 17918]